MSVPSALKCSSLVSDAVTTVPFNSPEHEIYGLAYAFE